ncbi:hypothetical protein [Lysobacter sp. F6437]|uniref:hypothetical protein n=1 Tax=Lysobacter sp. F6437 TaxID=3459296 RepID=UPI00403DC6C7
MDTDEASPRESEGQAIAEEAGLRYVHDDEPGIRRRKAGRGFSYVDAGGERVASESVRQRIHELAIPPAW